MWKEPILYEQPLNEHIRACLRLEHLFNHAKNGLRGSTTMESHVTLTAIIDILNVLDRTDLKSRLSKELSRHLNTLGRLEDIPDIDQSKLSSILKDLEDIVDVLHSTTGKIGGELRKNEFLTNIRQHLMTPGGTGSVDTPAYHLWLRQPASERTEDLENWLKTFKTIQTATTLLLNLIRQSCQPQIKTAHDGFYQSAIDPQSSCQLIRVAVPNTLKVYPEISAGRHALCVRFFPLELNVRPAQVEEDIEFKLTNCVF